MTACTQAYLTWIKSWVHFLEQAQQWVLEDYVSEVEHCSQRIKRREGLIDEAVETAPETMREAIAALQALRGIAAMSAATIVAEVGELSRFATARQLMGYSGAVASEHSSGQKTQRGHITKTGNAHLGRIVVEAAWSQRFKPIVSRTRKLRQEGLDPGVIEISTKAMHRLHERCMRLLGKGKTKQQVITAVAREMLGFIWAIGVAVEAKNAA